MRACAVRHAGVVVKWEAMKTEMAASEAKVPPACVPAVSGAVGGAVGVAGVPAYGPAVGRVRAVPARGPATAARGEDRVVEGTLA